VIAKKVKDTNVAHRTPTWNAEGEGGEREREREERK